MTRPAFHVLGGPAFPRGPEPVGALAPWGFGHKPLLNKEFGNWDWDSPGAGMVQNTVTSTGSVAAEWQSNLRRFLCKSPLGSLRCIAHIHTRCATQKSLLLNHAVWPARNVPQLLITSPFTPKEFMRGRHGSKARRFRGKLCACVCLQCAMQC